MAKLDNNTALIPSSGYVTGQSFTIDSGLEMGWGQGA
jgi:hypothetical protein